MRKRSTGVLLAILFFVGLSLLLYPTVSNWWNSYHQSKAVADYADAVLHVDSEVYARLLEEARAYNKGIAALGGGGAVFDSAQRADYEAQLNVDGSGVMGYIEIERLRLTLPIYHGTSDEVLQIAVGHVEGTSLPVGGPGTHCVLSGHRGLPSARLFTDIDQLTEGDTFLIRTLKETLTYEVDQIHTVLPEENGDLRVEPGEDYCTLLTCTPYGVNTHRLLVRGRRVENRPGVLAVPAEGIQIRPVIVMPALAAPVLLLLLILALVRARRVSPRTILERHRRKRNAQG